MTRMTIHRHVLIGLLAVAAFTAKGQLVINEVDYDQPGTDAAEFLELLNTGTAAFPLQYVQVVMVNGNAGGATPYATLSSESWPALGPGEYFVICANAATANCDAVVTPATNLIQNGVPDAIVLVMTQPTPAVLDALSYGGDVPGYTEGTGASELDSNLAPDLSLGRFPDGTDTDDNNADFKRMCSTPGTANIVDPVLCDLGIGVREQPAAAETLIVLPSPDGDGVLVFDANAAGEPLRFELFTTEGALVATRPADAAPRASWHIAANGLRGRLLLVQAETPSRKSVRRFIMP